MRLTALVLLYLTLLSLRSVGQQCNNWLSTPANSSYVDAGDLDVPGNQITVEAMINRTTTYTGGRLYAGDVVSKHDGPLDVNYLLRPNSAEITTNNGYFITPVICDIQLNKTYHVAMTYDGASLKFYRNGFLMSQVAATGNLYQNNWPLRMGVYLNQFVQTTFIGYIDEVRIWNVVRTQTQLRTYMNVALPNPTTQTGLLAYYTFEDLLNKQGNPTWNGILGGAAAISQVNPTCPTFCPDSCNTSGTLQLSLAGMRICPGGPATLTLTTNGGGIGPGPYTLIYSDGTNSYTLNNVQSGVPFVLNPAPSVTTTYTLQSISGSPCGTAPITGTSATITVNPLPQAGLLGYSVCKGDIGALLFTTTSGTGPFTVIFSDGTNNFIANNVLSGSNIPTPYPIQNNSTFNLLSVMDSEGCERLSNFTTAIAPVIVRTAFFRAPPDKLVCQNGTVQLNGNNGNNYTYLWSPSSYLDNPNSPNPLASPDGSIQYTVIITEPLCSVDSSFLVNLTVNPRPIVLAEKANDIDCSTPTAQLSATGADSYLWTLSTGLDNAGIRNPLASLSTTTTYLVTGTNSFGCSNTDTLTVNVTNGGRPIFMLPNAFSPNGDRNNECFGIRRWGNVTVHEILDL